MIGQTISHYKILEKLGEGGMGVVYKGQDTKLDRMVALKFLPPHLNASEQDKARFIQEAKAASAINHPNICTIYSIEEHEGQLFIAMEFVDGRTLRERKENISVKQAIAMGIQIADGLAAAHEKGIVHRDIKPENIMVRKDGIVQIMDFGLAKLRGVSRLTKEGSTVGTAGYMSPEQVQGLDADHRSDIFSLGVLLYELFTGHPPFKGVHETAIAYEIVNVDVTPMSATKPEIDPALDTVVLECLEKDPNERMQSASQVAVDLKRHRSESSRQRASRITDAKPPQKTSSSGKSTQSVGKDRPAVVGERKTSWGVAAVIALVMLLVGYGISFLSGPKASPLPIVRASIDMPSGVRYFDGWGGHTSISPDGSMIVFAGSDSTSQAKLWVRPINSNESRPLLGTDNATYPFWSPNSKTIGFFADGKVKTIDAIGGPVLTLAVAPFGRGGAWSKNGEIIFSPSVSDPNLYAVPTSGGTPRAVTTFDSTARTAPRFPFFLPDGNHFLFSALDLDGSANNSDAYVGSLDSRETKEIVKGASHPLFASGYLFFLRQGILMTQPFDPGSFSLSDKPVSLQGNINSWSARAKADYSVSENGILVYAGSVAGRESEFVWVGSDGNETPIFQAGSFTSPSLSPSGTRIAYDELDEQAGKSDIWVYDIISKAKLRLTFAQQAASRPCWSRDGSKIYYNEEVGGSKANIFVKRSDGSGKAELLTFADASISLGYYPLEVSPDGRFLLLQMSNESKNDLASIDLLGTQRPLPVNPLGIAGSSARFSPDGKWIVYQSNETGASRVYVSSFDGGAGKWQISPGGGYGPHWHKDMIVYYSPSSNRHERVDISFTSGNPNFGQPQSLFPGGKAHNTFIHGAQKDGKKYFGLRPGNTRSAGSLSLVVNWKGLVEPK